MAADTYASLSDLRVAAYMNAGLRQLLHQKLDLRSTMIELPFQPGNGSAASKVGLWQPVDAFAAPGEDTASTVTNITDAAATLTVAAYRLHREITDLAVITGGPEIDELIAAMALSANYTIAGILTAAFPSLATSVGTSGVNLSVDDIYSAQYALQLQNVDGPFYAVLHGQQFNDFQASLRGETGAVAFAPATDAQLAIKGEGFKGSWHGLDLFTHSTVTTVNAGADRCGAVFGRGCFGYTEAPIDRVMPYMQKAAIPAGGKMAVEVVRGSVGALAGKTFVVGHYYPAVAELEDLRGVKVVTDA